jgi:hypothetical protein
MAPLLKQNASWQSIWGEGNLGNSYPTYDTRVAFGSGWSTGVASTMGGNFFKGGTGTALSFTPLNQCDTFIIGFAISPGSSSFTVNVNGGSTLATQNCTGTNAQGYLTITTTLGSNTLNIVSASTTVYINSIYAYNSTVKEISLFNTGWASAPIANEVNNTGGYTYNPLPGISNSNPDLVIIPQGINDWNLGTAFSAYNSSIQTAINQAKLNGASVILASDNASNTTYAVMAPYIADMKQLAAQNNIPYIDIWNLFGGGSYAVNNTAGLMTDAYHPNATGYGIIAPLYARALNAFM